MLSCFFALLIVAQSSVARSTYLDEIKEEYAEVGHGDLGLHGSYGYGDARVRVAGRPATHALSAHPPSDGASLIEYKLAGRGIRLRGSAALGDTGEKSETPLTFLIVGDSRILWKSKPIEDRGVVEPFDVDIENFKVLQLIIECKGFNGWCFGVWVDPRIEAVPVWVSTPENEAKVASAYESGWYQIYTKSLKIGGGEHHKFRATEHTKLVKSLYKTYGMPVDDLRRVVLDRKRQRLQEARQSYLAAFSPPMLSAYFDDYSANARAIHVGPRGGVYHFSKNGNKVYHPR